MALAIGCPRPRRRGRPGCGGTGALRLMAVRGSSRVRTPPGFDASVCTPRAPSRCPTCHFPKLLSVNQPVSALRCDIAAKETGCVGQAPKAAVGTGAGGAAMPGSWGAASVPHPPPPGPAPAGGANRGRRSLCLDLKAFERRLTEYIHCLQPATGRWRSKCRVLLFF